MKNIFYTCLLTLLFLLFISGCSLTESPEQSNVSFGGIFSESESSLLEEQYDHSSERKNNESYTDVSKEPLDEFCFVTEENGKSHVLIYTVQQFQALSEKRERGELIPMTADEIKVLIEETIALFESNEVIQIHGLDGKLCTYYGLPFYQSEAYLEAFGLFQEEEDSASFDYKKDLFEVIFKRIEVLHPNICDGFESDSKYVFTASQESIDYGTTEFRNALFNVYELGSTASNLKSVLANYPVTAFFFDYNDKCIGYIPDISHADPLETEQLLPDSILPSCISPLKYDYNGKVVVIELYENTSKKMIARLRFDEEQNPDIISDIQVRFTQFTSNFSGAGNAEQNTKYRAVVYLNGFPFASSNDTCILYCPDGNINLSNFSGGYNIFQHNIFFQEGCSPLTEYINELLRTNLTT